MSNYVPRSGAQKKKDFLAQREQELQHAIRNCEDDARLARAVERVRAAKLNLIKALLPRWYAEPSDNPNIERSHDKLRKEREEWEGLTEREILDRYSSG